ncbi:MAG TPA: S8 family peptidase [Elusimicrobiota bacterium]|nr:S8 family peptidase [Elusimicrobiota bacterium]
MRLTLKIAVAALLATPGLANALPAPQAGMKRWIVTFKPKVKQAGRDAALASLNVKAAANIATDGDSDNEYSASVVDLPAGQTLANKSADASIVSIEADQRVKWIDQAAVSFQATPFAVNMEAFHFPKAGQFTQNPGKLAALANRPEITWGINRVHAPAAWDTTEGAGVKVAVIDTGIDLNHPDLAGKVDGGYSAITKTEKPEDYQDDNGHGTHVSGTIAALRDGKGVVGVAPKARLYAVKVLDADGSGNLSDVIDGIVWAAKNGMQVANMSLGAPTDSDAMHRAIRFAKGSGLVIVAAAGNSGGSVGFPGQYPEVITVSASDSNDHIASFSSRGPQVKFIAPGVDVVSDKLGGGFISYNGTSMATPHVTGLAALAVSQGWTGLTGPDGVLNQLTKAAKPLPGLSTDEQGAGMIDAGKLVH